MVSESESSIGWPDPDVPLGYEMRREWSGKHYEYVIYRDGARIDVVPMYMLYASPTAWVTWINQMTREA